MLTGEACAGNVVSSTTPVSSETAYDSSQLGLVFWEERRARWTEARSTNPLDYRDSFMQRRIDGRISKNVTQLSLDGQLKIYDKCVEQKRSFNRPINLAQIIPILKAGWIKNGIWPEGQEAPSDTT